MISLSKQWAVLSRAMYGQPFIDELAGLFEQYDVKSVLECGCGDGYILHGLAEKGFSGIGIDSDSEMISLALQDNSHSNISFRRMNWLDLPKIDCQFDAVMCRGNSLAGVSSWGKERINPKESREKIEKSVKLFFEKLKHGGLLYLDTTSESVIQHGTIDIEVKTPELDLSGRIECDLEKRTRRVFGHGKVLGKDFNGGSASYLLTLDELEEMVKSYNPQVVWQPRLIHENNYNVVCAVK